MAFESHSGASAGTDMTVGGKEDAVSAMRAFLGRDDEAVDVSAR